MKTWVGHLFGGDSDNELFPAVHSQCHPNPSLLRFHCDTEIRTFAWVSLGRKLWLHENSLDFGLASGTGIKRVSNASFSTHHSLLLHKGSETVISILFS